MADRNKYGAVRTYSSLCQRWFDSKGECQRGEELHMLELAGEISGLRYQVKFTLSVKPPVSITVDFAYNEDGKKVYEDFKGKMVEDFRVKMAWLKQQQGIDIILSRRNR